MKISILIPTYNYDVRKLTEDLLRQAENANLSVEVLIYDDASVNQLLKKANCEFASHKSDVIYKDLPQNAGRSKIRNLMAADATGEWLLFLDCDSGIIRDNFLTDYVKASADCDVICGGRLYNKISDENKEFILHTKTGMQRENLQSTDRKPAFMTCNFFIKKDVFDTLQFDETIIGYGHEDTIFGIDLEDRNFKIKNIDNPVVHLDLKNTDRFLTDLQSASRNLRKIYAEPQYHNRLSRLPIIRIYNKLKKFHCVKLFCATVSVFLPFIIKQLHSARPNLYLLDIFKLNEFCKG